ncbi:HD domain-containing phosphohydrolase, partial [Massilia sp. ZL223]|uniref:HD domain-containing phosphohydrolase n=2 Tax=unclassified Massilia TaxID=2609279 RepID=UPI001B814274
TAPGFAALLGDDIGGRRALLADPFAPRSFRGGAALAAAHAEVAGELAAMLGLPAAVEHALRHLFARGAETGQIAALAGDLELLARTHGLDAALAMIARLAGRRYPAALAQLAAQHAGAWLEQLGQPEDSAIAPAFLPLSAPLAPVADAVELKLPWLAGYGRRVAFLAREAAVLAGLPDAVQRSLVRAALLHGLGRAGVPNRVWQGANRLEGDAREAARRAPYLTGQLLGRIPGLEEDGALASQAYERLDGSGYYRGMDAAVLGQPQRILAAAAAHAALRAPRPWRAAHEEVAATALLDTQAAGGRFDREAVALVTAAASQEIASVPAALSAREREVLLRISRGESERAAARAMRLSAGAVRAHLERALEELGCATRPAATLRALARGLL